MSETIDGLCPWCGYDVGDSLFDWAQCAGRRGTFAFTCYGCGKDIHGTTQTIYTLRKLERPKVQS